MTAEPPEPAVLPLDPVAVDEELIRPRRLPTRTPVRRLVLSRLRGYQSAAWLVKRGLRLGRDVYLGEVYFDYGFLWLISIGDGSVLTNGVRILAHDASTKHWTGNTRIGRVDIGRRVYVGVGSIVLPGVRIGEEAIVGAGSVVSRDVPPRTVVSGNPAAPIVTLKDFAAKHREQIANRPRFPRAGFSSYDGFVSQENMERMRRELEDGPGYIV